MGKSALIARFLLEHTRLPTEARLPFAYLDFDRPSLNISEPGTLLLEMLRQIDLQFAAESHFRGLLEVFEKHMTAAPEGTKVDPEQVWATIADLARLTDAWLGPRPYVIVLDTFEEVQFRGESRAYPFWEMLVRLQHARPFLRAVVSGRAPVTSLVLGGKPPVQMELGALDHDAAVAFAKSQGVGDGELAASLVSQVGGVPLSIKLAAAVVRREGANADGRVKELSGKSAFWFSTTDEVIQGQLYSRILGHLHDPVLERLAHPGLVLRRVTPPVILEVLNEPCGLGLQSLQEAVSLFDKLKRETALLAIDSADGSLMHRQDLRRTMLKLLVEKSPAQTRKIHRRAIEYYNLQTGWRAKAEWAYHRLQLDEHPDEADLRHPEIRANLQASLVELPAPSQHWLASLGFQVSEEILASAGEEVRERGLAARVEEVLPYGSYAVEQSARDLLVADSLNHASPLFRSAARVSAQLQQKTEPLSHVDRGLLFATREGKGDLVLGLLRERARLLRRGAEGLSEALSKLGDYARRFDDLPALLQHRLQTLELDAMTQRQSDAHLVAEIGSLLGRLTLVQLWGLFPLFENTFGQLDSPARQTVRQLMIHTESPFLKAAVEPAQYAARALIDKAEATELVQGLCAVWPYRVLDVQPPYSRESYAA